MISYGIAKAIYEEKWTLYSLVDTEYNGIAKNFVFEGTYEECQEKMKEMKEMDKLTDAEIEELQEKKKAIREELYDQVKEEMFKASSALEGMTPQQALDELARIDQMISMPPEKGITPNSWVILEINDEGEQFQKILSGWSGGYLSGDSWRLSSPIKEMNIDIDSDKIKVYTESGSWYNLYKDNQGLRMSQAGIYNQLKEQFGDKVEIIEL